VKTIDILDAYVKFETKLFCLTWKKKGKSKTSHTKSEEKGEFESPRNEFLSFKGGIPIMLGPIFLILEVWKVLC
jgi:hypothetical protein